MFDWRLSPVCTPIPAYHYKVTFKTGGSDNADLNKPVDARVYGSNGDSGKVKLKRSARMFRSFINYFK